MHLVKVVSLLVSVIISLAGSAQIVQLNAGNFQPNQQLIPGVIPNAFTAASWSIPALQNYLRVPIPGYKASEIFFKAVNDVLIRIGEPNHATFANLIAQNLASFDQFSFAFYLYFKGNVVQKFLTSEGFDTVSLPQRYADSLENAVKSCVVTDFESLERALLEGYVNFIQSLGYNFNDKAYILAVLFNEEVLAYQRRLRA